jgi:hypothetical protein
VKIKTFSLDVEKPAKQTFNLLSRRSSTKDPSNTVRLSQENNVLNKVSFTVMPHESTLKRIETNQLSSVSPFIANEDILPPFTSFRLP